MTREDVRLEYPSLFRFFEGTQASHPVWVSLLSDVPSPDSDSRFQPAVLERMSDAAVTMQGYDALRAAVVAASTHEELMQRLAEWYVAYLYRDHSPSIHVEENRLHIELSISNQQVVVSVAEPVELRSPHMHIHDHIEDPTAFVHRVHTHTLAHPHHAHAHHHVVANVVQAPSLHHERHLREYLKAHRAELAEQFPHTSGVVLVHANTPKEEAVFIPFHSDAHDLEWMLAKES